MTTIEESKEIADACEIVAKTLCGSNPALIKIIINQIGSASKGEDSSSITTLAQELIRSNNNDVRLHAISLVTLTHVSLNPQPITLLREQWTCIRPTIVERKKYEIYIRIDEVVEKALKNDSLPQLAHKHLDDFLNYLLVMIAYFRKMNGKTQSRYLREITLLSNTL